MGCGCDAEQAWEERCFDIDTNLGGGGLSLFSLTFQISLFSLFLIIIIF